MGRFRRIAFSAALALSILPHASLANINPFEEEKRGTGLSPAAAAIRKAQMERIEAIPVARRALRPNILICSSSNSFLLNVLKAAGRLTGNLAKRSLPGCLVTRKALKVTVLEHPNNLVIKLRVELPKGLPEDSFVTFTLPNFVMDLDELPPGALLGEGEAEGREQEREGEGLAPELELEKLMDPKPALRT